MAFRVSLSIFRGPLDLLLYLVRKNELDILDIPVAAIAEQFANFITVLQELDIDEVGEFLEVASTLAEIKSRMVLPRGGEEVEEFEDPRDDLVQRLLAYKKFRDAASILEDRSRAWQQHYPRIAEDAPSDVGDPALQPIFELELWDLVSAFGRVTRDAFKSQPESIVYDDTPMHVYMARIHEQLRQQRRVAFSEMFLNGMHKSAMIGVFLAVLELVRHHNVVTEQPELHGEIWVVPGPNFIEQFDQSKYVDSEPTALNLDGITIRTR